MKAYSLCSMIISMSDIICITNRKLCDGDFFERIDDIARQKPKAIVLREKDMSETGYAALAKKVTGICKKYDVPCILHSFYNVADNLGTNAIHLPLCLLRQMNESKRASYKKIGTSCHSIADAIEAEKCGCTYIIAGHIFATDCKKGVPPRGIDFLSDVCRAVEIPVYAIGGINKDNIVSVRQAGAAGGCIMSGLMICSDVQSLMEDFQNE